MKRFVPMLLATGVVAGMAGCSESDPVSVEAPQTNVGEAAPAADAPIADAPASAVAEGVLVSLSVPNMT